MKTGNEDNKKRAAFFLSCSFFWWRVVCAMEAFSADWNSPAELRERPEGDRLIELLFCLKVSYFFSYFNR
ncbi:hypothetical protein EH230_07920 [Flavobacterium columnare]|uniref:Uncharacterized protein n=1 Tax=Flavobacterium columnare TaxID=996 RepID=A0A437UB44_9FLAO|nr:hypothetical protein EH230_07890 [Flavobacterium columnare]RVU90831.1 hypothetical protein EH230_07920 [Flavobacterium columnare]